MNFSFLSKSNFLRMKLVKNSIIFFAKVKPSLGHVELTLLANERQTPREDIHEVGQPVGVRAAVELSDVHDVDLVLKNCSLKNENSELKQSNIREQGNKEGRDQLFSIDLSVPKNLNIIIYYPKNTLLL